MLQLHMHTRMHIKQLFQHVYISAPKAVRKLLGITGWNTSQAGVGTFTYVKTMMLVQ